MEHSEASSLPVAGSLRQVVGALVFGQDRDLSPDGIRKCLQEVARSEDAPAEAALYAQASTADIRDALIDLRKDIARLELGFELAEVASGWRFQTQAATGRWVRNLLRQDRPSRLSNPALETLSIVAYRQPIAKSEIEGIRGVSVDHILRALMEMRLVRVAGRSDLPGRPFLYGTTATFLDHFGLRSLDELDDMDPTLQRSKPKERAAIHRRAKPQPPARQPDEDEPPKPADAKVHAPAETPAPEDGEGALRELPGPAKTPPDAEPVPAPRQDS